MSLDRREWHSIADVQLRIYSLMLYH